MTGLGLEQAERQIDLAEREADPIDADEGRDVGRADHQRLDTDLAAIGQAELVAALLERCRALQEQVVVDLDLDAGRNAQRLVGGAVDRHAVGAGAAGHDLEVGGREVDHAPAAREVECDADIIDLERQVIDPDQPRGTGARFQRDPGRRRQQRQANQALVGRHRQDGVGIAGIEDRRAPVVRGHQPDRAQAAPGLAGIHRQPDAAAQVVRGCQHAATVLRHRHRGPVGVDGDGLPAPALDRAVGDIEPTAAVGSEQQAAIGAGIDRDPVAVLRQIQADVGPGGGLETGAQVSDLAQPDAAGRTRAQAGSGGGDELSVAEGTDRAPVQIDRLAEPGLARRLAGAIKAQHQAAMGGGVAVLGLIELDADAIAQVLVAGDADLLPETRVVLPAQLLHRLVGMDAEQAEAGRITALQGDAATVHGRVDARTLGLTQRGRELAGDVGERLVLAGPAASAVAVDKPVVHHHRVAHRCSSHAADLDHAADRDIALEQQHVEMAGLLGLGRQQRTVAQHGGIDEMIDRIAQLAPAQPAVARGQQAALGGAGGDRVAVLRDRHRGEVLRQRIGLGPAATAIGRGVDAASAVDLGDHRHLAAGRDRDIAPLQRGADRLGHHAGFTLGGDHERELDARQREADRVSARAVLAVDPAVLVGIDQRAAVEAGKSLQASAADRQHVMADAAAVVERELLGRFLEPERTGGVEEVAQLERDIGAGADQLAPVAREVQTAGLLGPGRHSQRTGREIDHIARSIERGR